MTPIEITIAQTAQMRETIRKLVEPMKAKADLVPPGWKNNLRWHIGHLVITPRLVTFGLMKESLGAPEEYRRWFAKDTGPAAWNESDKVPPLDQLLEEMQGTVDDLARAWKGREEEPFPTPYTTTPGVVLSCPVESLVFSECHDGIHLGLILALRRALQ